MAATWSFSAGWCEAGLLWTCAALVSGRWLSSLSPLFFHPHTHCCPSQRSLLAKPTVLASHSRHPPLSRGLPPSLSGSSEEAPAVLQEGSPPAFPGSTPAWRASCRAGGIPACPAPVLPCAGQLTWPWRWRALPGCSEGACVLDSSTVFHTLNLGLGNPPLWGSLAAPTSPEHPRKCQSYCSAPVSSPPS